MIEVNLLPGPKKKKAAGPGLGFSLDELKAVFATIKDPLLLGAAGSWALALLVVGFFFFNDARRLVSLQSDLDRVETEQRRFSALIAQKRKYEQLRDSLVAEITVIRRIDGERFVWPHILEEIGRALPEYTWLTSIQPMGAGPAPAPAAGAPPQPAAPPSLRFSVEGRTTDIQAYTRFMRQLGNSPWITDIVAGATNVATEQDRAVTTFTLTAAFKRADSAYIKTAPLLQTLR